MSFFSFLACLLISLFAVSLAVVIHELGHYAFASLFGVTVRSVDFGLNCNDWFKPVFTWTWGNTQFRIYPILVGGSTDIVGFQGYLDYPEKRDDKNFGFYSVNPLKRVLICLGGCINNILLALFLISTINAAGIKYYNPSTKILTAYEIDGTLSPAYEAGLRNGDNVLSVNDKPVKNFYDLEQKIYSHPNEDLVFKVLRNGKIYSFVVHSMGSKDGNGYVGASCDPKTVRKYSTKISGIELLKDPFRKFYCYSREIVRCAPFCITPTKESEINVSGFLRIAYYFGNMCNYYLVTAHNITAFWVSFYLLLIFCNITLAIANLFPLPPLDGGNALLAIFEAFTEKKVNPDFPIVSCKIFNYLVTLMMTFGFFDDLKMISFLF